MARLFASASSQSAASGSIVIAETAPFTMAGWFKPTTSAARMALVSINDGGTSNFVELGINGTGQAEVFIQGGTASVSAGTVTNGTYAHLAGVATTNSSRKVFLNGVGATADTNALTPQTMSRAQVGAVSGVNLLNGAAAEIGIWSTNLTDDEVAALAKGYCPLLIRPQSLVWYLPLYGNDSPELDRSKSNLALTLTNSPTKADHPRVIYAI